MRGTKRAGLLATEKGDADESRKAAEIVVVGGSGDERGSRVAMRNVGSMG